jgi:hypothetical protein
MTGPAPTAPTTTPADTTTTTPATTPSTPPAATQPAADPAGGILSEDPGTPPAATPPAAPVPPAADPKADTKKPAAKAADPATAKKADAVLDAGEEEEDTQTGDWPDDWREKYAGDDEKKLAALKRYADPKSALDALMSAQARIKAGGLAKPLPKDATPEQIKEWREHNGIPEKPEDYKIELGEGFVLGDDDKPYIDKVLAAAHANNASPAAVNAIVQSYLEQMQADVAERVTADREYNGKTIETLRADWGGDFDANKNTIVAFLDAAPPEVKASILSARDGEGNLLRNNADFLKFIVGRELEYNPAATIVAGSGRDHLSGVQDEIAVIEKRMREDRPGYNKDGKMQERYMQLLTAREKIQSRGQ